MNNSGNNHSCGCEHHHHHDHHHHDHEDCGHPHHHDEIYAASSEEPGVLSFTRDISSASDLTGPGLESTYVSWVKQISGICEEKGLFIGHIKLHLNASGQSLWLSATDNESISRKATDGWGSVICRQYVLKFTAIIFDISACEIEDLVNDFFENENIT